MTTLHHPPTMGASLRPSHEWLWIGLSAFLVALVAVAFTWAVTRPADDVNAQPEMTSGFDYTQEATAGQQASPGVTGDYYGYSGELEPSIVILPTLTGFDVDHEATAIHWPSPAIAREYYGYSGELLTDE